MEIKILNDNVVNKIAAGEVIERPSSVVKELVENSIDAHAYRISVYVERGGKSLIRVEDNGVGISKDDLPLAVMRYATSKISDEKDLERIKTLGFRGEALAAISSVSSLTIESKKRGVSEGYGIKVVGGKIEKEYPVGLPEGTRVIVESLFFNTPVRLKFMKSEQIELSHIISLVESYALSSEKLSFTLYSDGMKILETSRISDKRERFFELFPEYSEEDFIVVEKEIGKNKFWALTSFPQKNLSTMNRIFIFVNGRFVKDRMIIGAILNGYQEMIESKRFPIGLYFLDVPCEDVDVNVHPTKREIKFRRPQTIFELISSGISEKLKNEAKKTFYFEVKEIPGSSEVKNFVEVSENLSLYNFDVKKSEVLKEALKPSPYRVIAIWRRKLLICDSPDGITFVDQHTLSERLRYEDFRKFLKNRGEQNRFLEVRTYSVPRNLRNRIEDLCKILNEHGFEAEAVSENAIGVRSAPLFVKENEIDPIIEEFLINGGEILKSYSDFKKEVMVLRACRGAVMFDDELTIEKAQYLLDRFSTEGYPLTCPHGRPIFYNLKEKELLSKFQRTK